MARFTRGLTNAVPKRDQETYVIRRIVITALLLCACSTSASEAKATLCERAYVARIHVVQRFGPYAAGRNICRFGIRVHVHKHTEAMQSWLARRPTTVERAIYLRQLENLLRPAPPFLLASGVPSRRPPAGVFRRSYAPAGLAACITNTESHNNPRANNGSHFGLAQWSLEAWSRMGGTRYAARADYATYEQQLLVLSYGLVHYGCRDWCPFDPC